ncbi:MAG: flagellar protein FliS [Lachnospiraceae bacterium]|nr:flagellar protein FliS [Lachnospiraceae bacterium]
MNDEKKREFTRRITAANPTEMIVILYDMTLTYLEDAREAIDTGDIPRLSKELGRARGCLSELIRSLHLEYDPAPVMMQLYRFCIRRLAACEASKNPEPLEEIRRVVGPLRDSYAQLAAKTGGAPVMDNSQSVYAGLTYGRGSLNENLVGNANRGFLV